MNINQNIVSISDCGPLVPPANGSVKYYNGTTFRSLVVFECETGYSLVGEKMRTCQANTLWSSSNPTCEINGKTRDS